MLLIFSQKKWMDDLSEEGVLTGFYGNIIAIVFIVFIFSSLHMPLVGFDVTTPILVPVCVYLT